MAQNQNMSRKKIFEGEKGIKQLKNRLKSFVTVQESQPKEIDNDLSMSNYNPNQPTIGIITALPKEYAAVRTILENPVDINREGQGGGRRYLQGEVPSRNQSRHTVILCLASMGTDMAAIRASLLLNHFPDIKSIIMVGIAGGIPYPDKADDHVRLGDIVVSNEKGVIQYDFDKETFTEITHRNPPRPPSASLLEGVRLLEADELTGEKSWLNFIDKAILPEGEERPPIEDDILVDSDDRKKIIEHPVDKKRKEREPRVFQGAIASANKLLKNPKKRDELRNKFGVKAVEMEGSGIADATWNYEIGYLVIRGICDYCDSNKGDHWQAYAAAVATAYTRALLESMPVLGTQGSIVSQDGDRSSVLDDDPKIKALKQDILQLEQEYEVLSQQARNSLSSVERIRLQNQAETIYNELMAKKEKLK